MLLELVADGEVAELGALRSHATAWQPDQLPYAAAPMSSAMRMASPVLKRAAHGELPARPR